MHTLYLKDMIGWGRVCLFSFYNDQHSNLFRGYFIDWLEKTLSERKPVPKLVTVVNPGNPSGTYIPEPLLKVISFYRKSICAEISE